MSRSLAALMFFFLLVVAPRAEAGGKAGEAAALSFHLETDQNENPKMIFPQQIHGQTRYFRRTSEISGKDVAAFTPFPADDGFSYGIVFQLKAHAARRLDAVTSANQGRFLLAQVNGRVADAVLIDQPIKDGILVIWKGVTENEIKMYDKIAPRIGEQKKKKKR